MQQQQDGQNHNGHDRDNEKSRRITPVTGIAIAFWAFFFGAIALWIVIHDHVADPAKSFEVFIASLFSLAIVIVVIVHAYMYFRQAKALDAQLEVSNRLAITALRQFEITDRPWLGVEVRLIGPLAFNEQGTNLNCRFIAKNVGRSVAVNATINAKVVIPSLGGDVYRYVFAEQSQVCQNVNSGFMSYAIFPDATFISDIGFGIGPEDLERGRLAGDDFRTDFFQIYLVGCVDYQFSGHDIHHQTRFIYEVYRTDPAGVRLALSIGQDVPLERLALYKTIIGRGDYAD